MIQKKKLIFFGFFAADGCITDYEMKFGISSKDIDILIKIKTAMESESEIKTYKTICSFTNNARDISTFSISNKHLVKTIVNLGFSKNKTTSCSFPNISEDFYLPFIRGYFDGDGSLIKYIANDRYTRYSCSICGTESLLLFIKNYLEQKYNCKFNSKLTKRFDTENCCYSLNMSGKKNCIHFLNLLYKNSTISLDRKYNKYLSFI